jgi:hypothetical protein
MTLERRWNCITCIITVLYHISTNILEALRLVVVFF